MAFYGDEKHNAGPEWTEATMQEEYQKSIREWEKYEYDIKELIRNATVTFAFYRQGHFYYNIPYHKKNDNGTINVHVLQFPVPIDDIGTATMLASDKAITFMRWIRRAIEDKTFIRI